MTFAPNRWRPYIVSIALLFPLGVTLVYFVALAGYPSSVQQLAYTLGKCAQFGLPLLWCLGIGHRSIRPSRPHWSDLIPSVVFGVLAAALMLVLYFALWKSTDIFAAASTAIREKIVGLGLTSPRRFINLGIFYALIHSGMEEYYWRWFIFGQLRTMFRLPSAVGISSLGFMAHHVVLLSIYFGWQSPMTWFLSAGIAIGGAMWALFYERSRSLYGPWLSHACIDAAIFVIGFDLVRAITK